MSVVLLSRDAGVLRITINRPEQRNAVNDEVLAALRAALDDAAADTSVRAVVLTGAGDKAFCAGADLRQALDSGGGVFTGADTHPFIEVFRAAERLGKPLIARINGHAMAGGLGLVCMCVRSCVLLCQRFCCVAFAP
jgi:enoyl-CoA hydratase/carnithine racemase